MNKKPSIIALFGTRPEILKMSPVLHELNEIASAKLVLVSSGQQADLIPAFIDKLNIPVAEELGAMTESQSINELLGRLLIKLEETYAKYSPDAVLIQGDTTTALAGAIGAFHRQIPVLHIESGLRSGNKNSPFPEELNRRLIAQLSSLHFAPTERNVTNLINEGVAEELVVLSGNPIVDAVVEVTRDRNIDPRCRDLLSKLTEHKIIVLTMHRRENFGERVKDYFATIKEFVKAEEKFAVVLPLHPNPDARESAMAAFASCDNVFLVEPFDYASFIHLLRSAWLAISDSGGIQEEVATLGVPLLILRDNTERPEIVDSGVARLVKNAKALEAELDQLSCGSTWPETIQKTSNPFGTGNSAKIIARSIIEFLS